jgi:Cys-rich repeat protein
VRSIFICFSLIAAGCQCTPPPSRCHSDAECASPLVCNTADATCVECRDNAMCPTGLCLPDGTCAACGPNAACPQGQLCGANGQCRDGCETPIAGCPVGQFCLSGSSACVECTNDAQCGPGRVCDANHMCRAGCSSANPNCMSGTVCDADAGTCVGCLGNQDCSAPPVCNPATHSCVSCLGDSDCHGAGAPHCDTSTNTCVACNLDPECGPGAVCRNHACIPGCSMTNPNCAAGKVCDVPLGQCVECLSDANCHPGASRCEAAAHRCVECLPSNDNCPVGNYCRADFVCERGCKTGANCPSGQCVNHSCTACTADSQCAAGNVCDNGTCIAACSSTNHCGTGNTCCGMHCEDLQNDRNNCGACGNVCGSAQSCCGGQCVGLDTNSNCGACGNACGSGQGCCAGACQSTTTLQRCGACNVACGVDQFCDGLACQNVVFPNFCINKKVYAIYDGLALDDGATNVLASTIAANCSQTTVISYGPQSNASWVDQTTGALLLGGGSTIVTAGGPVPNKPVKWMERTSLTTKVYFASNNIDTFYFKKRSDSSNITSMLASTCSPHHDKFLVELAADPSSGTLALIGYGLCGGGYGTQAAGWFYANVMLPNRMAYPDSWYLFEWNDSNNDGLPNLSDSFTQLASGQ